MRPFQAISPWWWIRTIVFAGLCPLLVFSFPVWAEGDALHTLRMQLDAQQDLILKQGKLLEKQTRINEMHLQEIQELKARIEHLDPQPPHPAPTTTNLSPSDSPRKQVPEDSENNDTTIERGRDSVGDLNTTSVKEGDFPGAILIPGTGAISFAIGGFLKTAAILDTKFEDGGAGFLPAQLGVNRNDKDGNFGIDSSTTRLYLDARAPVPKGTVRAYLEFDLNENNDGTLDLRIRHAKGILENPWGILTAGQTWTTLTDVRLIPEGLLEPTISGSILQRQPLLRWTQPLNSIGNMHVALEDPNSDDVFNNSSEFGHTPFPDVVLAGELIHPDVGYFRLGGVYRRIKVDKDDGGNNSGENGWGISSGFHLNSVGKDYMIVTGTYGKGLARYLIGLSPTASGVVDPSNGNLKLRKNFGGYASYQRHWTNSLRSNFGLGYARAKTFKRQAGNAFSNSTYGYVNLMWRILPYLTFGTEYVYGRREDKDNSDKDNHRIMIGTQIF